MTELEPGVPERVPQRRGELVDAARLAVVDEQDVDVALRRQLPGGRSRRRRRGRRRPGGAGSTILRRRLGEQPDEQRRRWRRTAPGTSCRPPSDRSAISSSRGRGGRRCHPRRVRDRRRPCHRGDVPRSWPGATTRRRPAACARPWRASRWSPAMTTTAASSPAAVEPTPSTVPTTTAAPRVDDGVLRIGLLLPESGEGATIGQPLIDAALAPPTRSTPPAACSDGRSSSSTEFDEGNNAADGPRRHRRPDRSATSTPSSDRRRRRSPWRRSTTSSRPAS